MAGAMWLADMQGYMNQALYSGGPEAEREISEAEEGEKQIFSI